jgi:hypothetical protein
MQISQGKLPENKPKKKFYPHIAIIIINIIITLAIVTSNVLLHNNTKIHATFLLLLLLPNSLTGQKECLVFPLPLVVILLPLVLVLVLLLVLSQDKRNAQFFLLKLAVE